MITELCAKATATVGWLRLLGKGRGKHLPPEALIATRQIDCVVRQRQEVTHGKAVEALESAAASSLACVRVHVCHLSRTRPQPQLPSHPPHYRTLVALAVDTLTFYCRTHARVHQHGRSSHTFSFYLVAAALLISPPLHCKTHNRSLHVILTRCRKRASYPSALRLCTSLFPAAPAPPTFNFF